jgi:hypothetical protein
MIKTEISERTLHTHYYTTSLCVLCSLLSEQHHTAKVVHELANQKSVGVIVYEIPYVPIQSLLAIARSANAPVSRHFLVFF